MTLISVWRCFVSGVAFKGGGGQILAWELPRMALASQSLISEWLLAKSILGRKYGTRTKREISTIIPWLRDRGEILASLSETALEDLAQNVILTRFSASSVVSQQGERGNSLYFILRGKVTMYIDPSCAEKVGSRELLGCSNSQYFGHSANKKPKSSSHKNKSSFGTDVRCLVTGNYFNESAVITRDGILMYSVITDEPTDCILISKKLFDRTLSEKFKLDTLSKLEFATALAHNVDWVPNAIVHLALSVWEETYPFGSFITVEGKDINALYAIKSGVVKLSVNPSRDVSNEVLNLIAPPENHLADILSTSNQMTLEDSERQRKAHLQYHFTHLQHSVEQIRKNHPTVLKNKANICMLGPGDYIGSTEALFSVKFSNFTAICDSPVTVYCLDHVNFQMWVTKRYPLSARHMHLVNQTILVEWVNRFQGAAILSCLLAMTNQELTRLQRYLVKNRHIKYHEVIKGTRSPKQLALRIARSLTTFSWKHDEISKLTKEAELCDSAFFSQPFAVSYLQDDNPGDDWKDSAICRPFTAPVSSINKLSSGVISNWSLASADKIRGLSLPTVIYPPPKPHNRASPPEAFTVPISSTYLSSPVQEQGVNMEEDCKLSDSVDLELSLSVEGIHGNYTSLTTVSSLPDNCTFSKQLMLNRNPNSYHNADALLHRDSVSSDTSSMLFTPRCATEDLLTSRNVSGCVHHKTHSDPPLLTSEYPATPANSPVKRMVKSACGRFRVSSALHTSSNDCSITPLMEEDLSSSTSETALEELEIKDTVVKSHYVANWAASSLKMQQFTYPHVGRSTDTTTTRLRRPKKSPVYFPPTKSSRIPHPSMVAMYMEQRASLPQPLFKSALHYCSTIPNKLDYHRPR